jgi:hypothetical protein
MYTHPDFPGRVAWTGTAVCEELPVLYSEAALYGSFRLDDIVDEVVDEPEEPETISVPGLSENDRAALLWVLWHHQGSNSAVGQPIRKMLSMGQYEKMSSEQAETAKRCGEALLKEANTHTPYTALDRLNIKRLMSVHDSKSDRDAFDTLPDDYEMGDY